MIGVNSEIVIARALSQVCELWKALDKGIQPCEHCSHIEWPSLPLQHSISLWQLPARGWIKVNFDRALSSKGAHRGGGFVIRDFVGNLLIACNISLVSMSIPIAEITEAWASLRCAILELGAKKIWLKGDSMVIVHGSIWIKATGDTGWVGARYENVERTYWGFFIHSHFARRKHGGWFCRGFGSKGRNMQYSRHYMPEELRSILYKRNKRSYMRKA